MAKRTSSDGTEYEELAEAIFRKIHANDENAKSNEMFGLIVSMGKDNLMWLLPMYSPIMQFRY